MNVPGGGKNDIPNRLKRHFAIFYVPPPNTAAMNFMFGALVQVQRISTCTYDNTLLLSQEVQCSHHILAKSKIK